VTFDGDIQLSDLNLGEYQLTDQKARLRVARRRDGHERMEFLDYGMQESLRSSEIFPDGRRIVRVRLGDDTKELLTSIDPEIASEVARAKLPAEQVTLTDVNGRLTRFTRVRDGMGWHIVALDNADGESYRRKKKIDSVRWDWSTPRNENYYNFDDFYGSIELVGQDTIRYRNVANRQIDTRRGDGSRTLELLTEQIRLNDEAEFEPVEVTEFTIHWSGRQNPVGLFGNDWSRFSESITVADRYGDRYSLSAADERFRLTRDQATGKLSYFDRKDQSITIDADGVREYWAKRGKGGGTKYDQGGRKQREYAERGKPVAHDFDYGIYDDGSTNLTRYWTNGGPDWKWIDNDEATGKQRWELQNGKGGEKVVKLANRVDVNRRNSVMVDIDNERTTYVPDGSKVVQTKFYLDAEGKQQPLIGKKGEGRPTSTKISVSEGKNPPSYVLMTHRDAERNIIKQELHRKNGNKYVRGGIGQDYELSVWHELDKDGKLVKPAGWAGEIAIDEDGNLIRREYESEPDPERPGKKRVKLTATGDGLKRPITVNTTYVIKTNGETEVIFAHGGSAYREPDGNLRHVRYPNGQTVLFTYSAPYSYSKTIEENKKRRIDGFRINDEYWRWDAKDNRFLLDSSDGRYAAANMAISVDRGNGKVTISNLRTNDVTTMTIDGVTLVEYANGSRETTNANGQLTRTIQSSSKEMNFTYDDAGRLALIETSDGDIVFDVHNYKGDVPKDARVGKDLGFRFKHGETGPYSRYLSFVQVEPVFDENGKVVNEPDKDGKQLVKTVDTRVHWHADGSVKQFEGGEEVANQEQAERKLLGIRLANGIKLIDDEHPAASVYKGSESLVPEIIALEGNGYEQIVSYRIKPGGPRIDKGADLTEIRYERYKTASGEEKEFVVYTKESSLGKKEIAYTRDEDNPDVILKAVGKHFELERNGEEVTYKRTGPVPLSPESAVTETIQDFGLDSSGNILIRFPENGDSPISDEILFTRDGGRLQFGRAGTVTRYDHLDRITTEKDAALPVFTFRYKGDDRMPSVVSNNDGVWERGAAIRGKPGFYAWANLRPPVKAPDGTVIGGDSVWEGKIATNGGECTFTDMQGNVTRHMKVGSTRLDGDEAQLNFQRKTSGSRTLNIIGADGTTGVSFEYEDPSSDAPTGFIKTSTTRDGKKVEAKFKRSESPGKIVWIDEHGGVYDTMFVNKENGQLVLTGDDGHHKRYLNADGSEMETFTDARWELVSRVERNAFGESNRVMGSNGRITSFFRDDDGKIIDVTQGYRSITKMRDGNWRISSTGALISGRVEVGRLGEQIWTGDNGTVREVHPDDTVEIIRPDKSRTITSADGAATTHIFAPGNEVRSVTTKTDGSEEILYDNDIAVKQPAYSDKLEYFDAKGNAIPAPPTTGKPRVVDGAIAIVHNGNTTITTTATRGARYFARDGGSMTLQQKEGAGWSDNSFDVFDAVANNPHTRGLDELLAPGELGTPAGEPPLHPEGGSGFVREDGVAILLPAAPDEVAEALLWQAREWLVHDDRLAPRSVEIIRKAAEAENMLGQFMLAEAYHHGWGVERDKVQAARWIARAAAQDGASSLLPAGAFLPASEYIDSTAEARAYEQRAMEFAILAAEKGFVGAQHALVVYYVRDIGGKTADLRAALKWRRKALESSEGQADVVESKLLADPPALLALDWAFAQKWMIENEGSLRGQLAATNIRVAAESGNAASQRFLGDFLMGQKQFAEALVWLDKAAQQGNELAEARAKAIREHLAREAAANFEKLKLPKIAPPHMVAAARNGDAAALFHLAQLHRAAGDLTDAKAWFEAAAAQNHKTAQRMLSEVERQLAAKTAPKSEPTANAPNIPPKNRPPESTLVVVGESKLRFDGAYAHKRENSREFDFLRFYPDGTVAMISGTFRSGIERVLDKKSTGVQTGKYVIDEDVIKWRPSSLGPTVPNPSSTTYEATLTSDSLSVKWQTRFKDGKSIGGDKPYTFEKIEFTR
jgi:YD repeat-containing protein